MFIVELEFGAEPGRLEARPAHRERLAALHGDGTVVLAGPFPDDRGALLLFNVPDAETLDRVMADDPYYRHPAVRVVRRQEWAPVIGAA